MAVFISITLKVTFVIQTSLLQPLFRFFQAVFTRAFGADSELYSGKAYELALCLAAYRGEAECIAAIRNTKS